MYSKKLPSRYIAELLKQKDWSGAYLAEQIGTTKSNFNRALNQEEFNFTLPQFTKYALCLNSHQSKCRIS